MEKDSHFGTVGAVLAAAGSAVGLGNIWRFPYMIGENGGAAFLIVYIACVAIFGIPVMTAEMYAGRRGLHAWRWIRPLAFFGVAVCLGFYFVVTGWCLHYMYLSILGATSSLQPQQLTSLFSGLTQELFMPLLWVVVSIALTAIVELAGVKQGIERISKLLMPLLFLILTLLIGCGLMMPGSEAGLHFLLHPDFSKITPSLVMNAMGQSFLSLSIGMGILATYAGFMKPEQNLYRTALQVSVLDTLVAVLAGLAIFPAVFALGIDPTEGPELVFVTLPSVFGQIRGGQVLQLLFFLLLTIAAITSTISLMQAQMSWLQDRWKMSRPAAIFLCAGIDLALAVVCTLSLAGVAGGFKIGHLSFFDFSDAFVSKLMFPLVGLLYTIYVGWKCQKEDIIRTLTPYKNHRIIGWITYVLIRYFIPLAVIGIMIDSVIY